MDLFCKEIWRRRRKWWGLVNCENDDEEEIEEENVLLPWCFCYVLGFSFPKRNSTISFFRLPFRFPTNFLLLR